MDGRRSARSTTAGIVCHYLEEARKLERELERKKNPKLAIYHLRHESSPESFRG